MGRVVRQSASDDGHADLPRCGPEDLFKSERILLWMLRQWVAARVMGQEPRVRMAARAGTFISPRGAASFEMLMSAIEERVRRPLCISHPDCRGYACDEQRLVVACGVSSASPEIAARLLETMVIAPGVVAAVARVLNFSFEREGLRLPLRLNDPRPAPFVPHLPTLH